MKDIFKGLAGLMVYFTIEAAIIALFISTIWLFTLNNKINIDLNFFDWFFIIFVFRILRFDILKFVDLNNLPEKQKDDNDEI